VIVTTQFKGLAVIERDLAMREARLIEGTDRSLKAIADYGADLIRTAMLSAGSPSSPGGAPGIATGNLIRSVQSEHATGSLQAVIRVGTAGRKKGGAPHWHLLEFGTVKMAARPVIRPSGKLASQHGQILINEVVRRA